MEGSGTGTSSAQPGVTSIKTITLTDYNYDIWSGKFPALLAASGKTGSDIKEKLIDTGTVSDASLAGDLKRLNQHLHQLLLLSTDGIAYNIVDAANGNGRKAWLDLRDKYQADTEAAATEILLQMFNVDYNAYDDDIDMLIMKVETLAAKLERLGIPVHDVIKRSAIFNSLGNEYSTVKTLLHASREITMEQFRHALRAHYDVNFNPANGHITKRSGLSSTPNISAFTASAQGYGGKCNWCNGRGHYERQCPRKEAGEDPADGSIAKARHTPGSREQCAYHKSPTHTSAECKVLQRMKKLGLNKQSTPSGMVAGVVSDAQDGGSRGTYYTSARGM
jgi:hypothetical protein